MRVTYVLDTLTEETSNRRHNMFIFSILLILCLSYRVFLCVFFFFVRWSVEKEVYPENVQFCAISSSSFYFYFFISVHLKYLCVLIKSEFNFFARLYEDNEALF